jgi:hypothetical protein
VGVYYRRLAPGVGYTDGEMGAVESEQSEEYVQRMGEVVMLLVKESVRKQTPDLKAALLPDSSCVQYK